MQRHVQTVDTDSFQYVAVQTNFQPICMQFSLKGVHQPRNQHDACLEGGLPSPAFHVVIYPEGVLSSSTCTSKASITVN